ncbi:hypothetical protein EZV62_009910 [Acer yangbiense]|uniref:ferric-chelate reductase (NADH) n=1 Tax=Acer yangbiense TaxID=1000413 RepID=A0A5C7I2W2_9ROSI|nr:hypothetical protein EZV62_009910 [Acer yangbiense]
MASKVDMVRAATKLLVMVVFIGSLLIWTVTPTNTYRQIWLPKIRTQLNSTYFGLQTGPRILINTFPILFMAVLGCIFLHLGKKVNDYKAYESINGKKQRLALLKKPIVVKGPLGIVSSIELGFFTMFIALLVWSPSIYIHNSFATITPISSAADGEQVWEAKLAALRLGLVGNICLVFLFFPVARGSSLLPLFGLTSEASIKYHIWLGHLVMGFFTAHGICYIVFWNSTNNNSQMVEWAKTGTSNVAGEIALLAGLAMWATTIPRIRQTFFELFFYTHYFYIIFMFFFVLHVGISYAYIMLPGFYLFLVDRYLRFLQSRKCVRLVSARVLPCETIELNFSKTPGLKYNPTSILFINVPSISKMQWHPFTITSNSNLEPEKISVMIKSEGSWSKKLNQIISSPNPIDRLQVSVEGPYGPASTHFLRHDTLVMVSGGSGITPFISVIRELIYASTIVKCKTPQIILICSFKNSSDLTMLDLLLPIDGSPIGLSNLKILIEAYVTREKQQPTTEQNSKELVRALWFKPNPTDSHISSILGPNSWLWLAVVISSSFIIFLILIGIISRYYIYPIDHNTNRVFSSSLKSFLHMLVMCVCIAATASVAVIWNKKQNAQEANQIQSLEVSTPTELPLLSSFYNADRELESLPYQSLVRSTNVRYGMLFDLKGSSVGVMVCGPKKMRHEIATICSSGLANNLHFESISFSW